MYDKLLDNSGSGDVYTDMNVTDLIDVNYGTAYTVTFLFSFTLAFAAVAILLAIMGYRWPSSLREQEKAAQQEANDISKSNNLDTPQGGVAFNTIY